MLKTEDHPVIYQREADVYEFDCIRESPYIRSLHEVVDNDTDKCMVFQWMDSDLWSLRKQRHQLNPQLPKIVAKSVLKALVAFDYMDGQGAGVHTGESWSRFDIDLYGWWLLLTHDLDVNPNNILVDGADTSSTVVKLSDLGGCKNFLVPFLKWGFLTLTGIVIHAYEEQECRLQGFAIRAPEIWMGKAPTPACDVWSLGVSVRFMVPFLDLFLLNKISLSWYIFLQSSLFSVHLTWTFDFPQNHMKWLKQHGVSGKSCNFLDLSLEMKTQNSQKNLTWRRRLWRERS